MPSRYLDWLRQAEAGLRHARNARASGDYEWSCFAAHQAGEKALKALFRRLGMDAWGHTLTALIGNLPAPAQPDEVLIQCAKVLDKHYIPTRCPNGFDSGAPTESWPSVVIKSADRSAIAQAVERYAAQLRREHPEIRRIIWFGSWVTGIPLPGSDVDLCLIVSEAGKPRRERSVAYLPVGFPVGVDLFVYTEAEFAQLAQEAPEWFAAIQAGCEI